MSVSERWRKTKPIAVSTAEAVKLARDELQKDGRILIAYLFGSRAENLQAHRPDERDIDLAMYTSSDFASDDYFRVIERLGGVLGSDRLDLMWLNTADPTMLFQVIRDGEPLFFRDAETLNDFERKAKHRYYDYKVYLKRHKQARLSADNNRRT